MAPYRRIVDEISGRIAAGALRPGDRIPSARQITRDWGVAIATATKVLATLRQEGLVEPRPGVGTVVVGAPQTRRVERPEPTREKIIRAAITVADAEGLAAVSMRRVATQLDLATMSLYRHVKDKDDLFLQMANTVYGEVRLPEPAPAGWRARVALVGRAQWTICRRHPWVPGIISFTRPRLAPNGMAQTEFTMHAMQEAGFAPADALYVAVAISGYVNGVAAGLQQETEAHQESGISSEEWMENQVGEFSRIMASGRFPMIAAVAAEPNFDMDLDRLFEFGLTLLLDGIERKLAP